MSLFRFRLQPLLEARERRERSSYAAWMEAARAYALARGRVAALQAERSRIARTIGAHAPALDPSGYGIAFLQLELVAAVLERRDSAMRASREREDAARAGFSCAHKDRLGLSALRDRAATAFAAELEQRETRELDETNAPRH